MKTFSSKFNSETFVFAILLGFIMVSSVYHLNFYYGVTFTFTSIFLFLILRLFGFRFAIFGLGVTFLFIPHEFTYVAYNLILFAEIMFVGTYFRIKKRAKMFFVDAFFWGTIGLSALFFLLHSSLNGDALYFQILNDIVNGLFNVLIADMLLAYFPFYKVMKSRSMNKNNVSIHQFLSHITIISIMVPFFLIILTKTWTVHELFSNNLKSEVEQSVLEIEKELHQLDTTLPLASPLQKGKLKEIVDEHTSPKFDLIITDSQNKMITSSLQKNQDSSFNLDDKYEIKEISTNFYEAVPKGQYEVLPILKWRSGKIVFETKNESLSIKLFIQYPLSQFQDQIFKEIIFHLKLSILYLIITIGIAIVVNRIIMNNLSQLTDVTTGLPAKVKNLETIEFPQSTISEFRLLSQNLKVMTQKLRESFQEKVEMNRILTTQTNKLKESEEKLHQLAYYDVLTSLPNRLHFQDYVRNYIKTNPSAPLAIIFIDLNQFKQVNDILGHNAGDVLLQLFANKLRTLQGPNREVFRIGGDEFVVVHQITNREEVYVTLEKIKDQFFAPITINGQVLYVTGSVGVSLYPYDGLDLDTLVKCADIAMYASKEKCGKNPQFYNDSMMDRFQERLIIENALRKVVNQGGFKLFYQPKIQFDVVSSIEALIRWNDPTLGNVSPEIFIPIAEEMGIISKIDEWALLEACKQNKKWQDAHLLKVPISVNISAKNFQQDDLILWIEKALYESGLSPQYLKLEITESTFIKHPKRVVKMLHFIKSLGVQISIDDFGKGYSSFTHLLELPVDEIKIDKKLITGIDQNEKQELLAKSIIDLGHGLQLNIVAEGVENPNERDLLIQLGCDELQGYLFSFPLNPIEMKDFLYMNTKSQAKSFVTV
jgi:diguanylate cyclase (GGDEF)-like protein